MRVGAPPSRDVALGLVAGAARAGRDAGHVALLPARVVMRAPVLGAPLRRVARDLAHEGALVRTRGRVKLELAAGELLAAPELERAVERLLASPELERLVVRVLERRRAENDVRAAVLAAHAAPRTTAGAGSRAI